MILAVDPGTLKSAYVLYDEKAKSITACGIENNIEMLMLLQRAGSEPMLVIEMVASYGMSVGASVFDTCVWTGRFIQAYRGKHRRMFRRDVKLYLCNSAKAKDGNVRQALIDRFPATGGGKTPQVGTKSQPGPLYGVSKDIWSALGVAVTYAGTQT